MKSKFKIKPLILSSLLGINSLVTDLEAQVQKVDKALYHTSTASFLETEKDTVAYGKKFVGLVQVGSGYGFWNAERTRDKSTTAASFYNAAFGSDKSGSKDGVIKEAMALTTGQRPEDFVIERDREGYIVDIYGKTGNIKHTTKDGKIFMHTPLKRGKIFWAPEEAVTSYLNSAPEKVRMLKNEITSLEGKVSELNQKQGKDQEERDKRITQLEERFKAYEDKIQEKKEEPSVKTGIFLGVQTNNYKFKIKSEQGEHNVNQFNMAGEVGVRFFYTGSSGFRPEARVGVTFGTDFKSERYPHKESPTNVVPDAVRFFKPYFSAELSLGGSYPITENVRAKFLGGAIKNLPGEKPVKDNSLEYELSGESLDVFSRSWIPTISAGLEFPFNNGVLSVLAGRDLSGVPMRRAVYGKIQWETGSDK